VSAWDAADGKPYNLEITWNEQVGLISGTFSKPGGAETVRSFILVQNDGSLRESFSVVRSVGPEAPRVVVWHRER
jgi:hypothetical protein